MKSNTKTKNENNIMKYGLIAIALLMISIVVYFCITLKDNSLEASEIGISEELYNSIEITLNKSGLGLTQEDIDNTTEIICENITSLEGIYNIPNLESVSIIQSEPSISVDITELNEVTNLKSISFYGESVDYNDLFDKFTNPEQIETLNISGENLVDITGINKFKNLKVLGLIHCSKLEDFNELSELTNLEDVTLNGNFTNVSMLKNSPNISYLFISSTSTEPFDFSDITYLTNVNDLGIAGTNVTDISKLNELSNLTKLRLINTSVNKIPELKNLESLTLQECNALTNLKDIENFSKLKDLKILMSNGLQKDCLESIKKIHSLESLSINYCENINTDYKEVTLDSLERS